MLRRDSSMAPAFAGSGAVAFGSFFSCAVDRAGQKIEIASNPHRIASVKDCTFVFAELSWRFERKGFSLNMFNPSAEDFLGATSSSPPEGMFHIQQTRLLYNCPRGGWKSPVPNR